MKILTIDDHALFRQGLKFLLSDLQGELEFLESATLAEALTIQDKETIEIILLDYHLPDSLGIDSLPELITNFEHAMVVVLSGEDEPDLIKKAIDAGAAGFIPKTTTHDILIAALKLIVAGGVYVPRSAINHHEVTIPHHDGSDLQPLVEALSRRQKEVLIRAVQGKANKVIARELFIAEGTVKAHLSAAFNTLGVSNRTEAVYMASKLNLIQV